MLCYLSLNDTLTEYENIESEMWHHECVRVVSIDVLNVTVGLVMYIPCGFLMYDTVVCICLFRIFVRCG